MQHALQKLGYKSYHMTEAGSIKHSITGMRRSKPNLKDKGGLTGARNSTSCLVIIVYVDGIDMIPC